MCILINEGRDAEAKVAIDVFLKDFSGRAELVEVFYWICKEYEWQRNTVEDRRTRYDICIAWYERLVKEFAESEFAEKAALDAKRLGHRTRIFTLIEDGNDATVDAAVDAMVRDLNGYPDAASELYWTGIEYELYPGGQGLSKRMLERVVEKHADSSEAGNASVGVLRMDILDLIEAGDINNAEAAIDRMVRDFRTHPHAHESLCRIAKVYYLIAESTRPTELRISDEERERIVGERRKYFSLARNVWQRAIDKLEPSSPYTAVAYYFVGMCERYMGEYEKAIENFEVVVRDWPDYEHVGNAQCSIAWCYEGMKRTGRLSEGESQRLSEQAYRDAVEKFGDSYWAEYAALKLAKKYDESGQWEPAVEYYRCFLELADADDSEIPYVMGRIEELEGTSGKAE